MNAYVLNGVTSRGRMGCDNGMGCGPTYRSGNGSGGSYRFARRVGATSTDDSGGGGGSDTTGGGDEGGGGNWVGDVANLINTLIGMLGNAGNTGNDYIETQWEWGPNWAGVPHSVHVWFTNCGSSQFLDWMRANHKADMIKGVPAMMAWFYYFLRLTNRTPVWPYSGHGDLENPCWYTPGWTEDVYATMGIDYWPSMFTHSMLGGPGYYEVPLPSSGNWTPRAAAEAGVVPGGTDPGPVPPGDGGIFPPPPATPPSDTSTSSLLPLGLLFYLLS